MKTAGIIGGSGFIGSHITKKFLGENFKVKVATTDISNKSKYEHLYELENSANLEIYPLDLRYPESLAGFVEGCNILVHGGTPFQLDVKDPQKELFEPTITGTNNFLSIINNTPGLEKVVFIASVAAWNTSFPMNPVSYQHDHIFSENDSPYYNENDHPYALAKFIADQSVRKFIKDNPDLKVDIVTVCPVMVIGEALSNRPDSTSQGMQYLIKNNIAANPFLEMLFATNVSFSMVDVRDVAESVFKAAIKSGLNGKNYLLANETYAISDISLMLNRQTPLSDARFTYNNSLVKNDLGISFIAAKETLYECS